jgi:gluconokinase
MILALMGVSGSGKTTVGRKLAASLGCPFFDADDFHSPASRAKMGQGRGLTEEDRAPWLETLGSAMAEWEASYPKTVLACSALKRAYREKLSGTAPVRWIYLKGDRALIRERMEKRKGHFAGTALLESQFGDLEEPRNALIVDIGDEPDEIVRIIRSWLGKT